MKALTIIGRGESWKECLFQTEELWGTASCLKVDGLSHRDFTKVFAFDEIDDELFDYVEIAKSRHIPIVSQREYATERFPMKEVAKEFGSSYWQPSLSYALAYALYLKYDRIFLYGIDQGKNWDYQSGKMHIMLWIGVALGRKVDLRLGRGSLRWAYRSGKDGLPFAYLLNECDRISAHIEPK